MEDVVFNKQEFKKDKMWENNPYLKFIFYITLGMIGLFGFLYLGAYSSNSLLGIFCNTLGIFSIVGFGVIMPVMKNNKANISKSIAVIKRNNEYYAIKLMYNSAAAGNMLYAPSGTLAQAATLGNNIEVAVNIQAMEREIRERRIHKDSFIVALNDILEYLEKNPNGYINTRNAKFEEKVDGFKTVITSKGMYGFINLTHPKIENENENYVYISYLNENKENVTVKLRNAYGGLIEDIKKANF